MRYREKYLVHWTAPDEVKHPCNPRDSEERKKYICHLNSILSDGFWLTKQKEEQIGGPISKKFGSRFEPPVSFLENIDNSRRSKLEYGDKPYAVCFSEIPLSKSYHHARRYGGLGIAVDREYVLDHWGAPVHYVRNSENEVLLRQHAILDAFLRYAEEEYASREAKAARRAFKFIKQFIKEMSDEGEDNFRYLEEREWRVTWVRSRKNENREEVESSGKVEDEKRGIEISECFVDRTNGQGISRFEMPVDVADIEALVFPDDKTRKLALQEVDPLQEGLDAVDDHERPALLTLAEAKDFEPHEAE